MNQLLLRRRAMMVGGANRPNYLKFTAQEDNCTVTLNKVGTPNDYPTEYALNKGEFLPYTYGDTINLNNGECVEFRRTEGYESTTFSMNDNNYYQFATTGTIYMDGNILSLLNQNMNTSIGVRGFYKTFPACNGLSVAPIVLTEFVTFLPTQGFDGCSAFSEVDIRSELSASTIGQICFNNCQIKTMKFAGTNVFENQNVLISKYTNKVYVDTIEYYISLTSIKNFSYVNTPGLSDSMLNIYINNQEVTGNIVVNSGVTIIGAGAFTYAKNITSIDLPNTITTICKNSLTAQDIIILRATTPPVLYQYNNQSYFKNTAKIYVPKGSLSSYLADSNWNNLSSQLFELDENGEIPS